MSDKTPNIGIPIRDENEFFNIEHANGAYRDLDNWAEKIPLDKIPYSNPDLPGVTNVKQALDTYNALVGSLNEKTLTSQKTIYVSIMGNDTTGEGSQNKPFATLTKAFSYIRTMVGSWLVTISLSPGVYLAPSATGRLSVPCPVAISGVPGSPSSVIIQNTATNSLWLDGNAYVSLSSITFSLSSTALSPTLYVSGGSVDIKECVFDNQGANTTGIGIYLVGGSAKIATSTFNKYARAVHVDGGFASIYGCSGSGNDIALFNVGSMIINSPTNNIAAITAKASNNGGQTLPA